MKKICLFLILLFICSCNKSYDMYEMPKEVVINLNENKFNVYEDHTSKELVSDANVEIISEDELKTDEVGTFTYTLSYKYKKRLYKYDIEYSVVDTVPPVFISSPSSFTVQVNTDDIFCDRISFGDNYDAKVECAVDGYYDFTQVGAYDLEFVLKDSSENETRDTFTLYVVNQINKNNNVTKKPNYLYIDDILKYKNDNTSIGIDVSKWQGNIDFKKVKDAGIEFVIMRVGFQREPGGEYELDPRFLEYYEDAKKEGLKVSVYLYTYAISEKDGINAANWIIRNLGGEKMDFPIAYDWENWSSFNEYEISLHTLSASYLAFEKTLKKHGYDSMLYSSKFYLENVWLDYDNTNIWLAHYVDQTNYQGDYMMWQMTSLAKIDGITDNTVDIDILYKNKEKE